MKKSIFIIAFLCTFLMLPKAHAQFSIGAGASYVFNTKDPAIYLKAIQEVNKLFSGQFTVTRVFDGFEDYSFTQFDLGPRVQYHLYKGLSFQTNIGFSFAVETFKFNGERDTSSESGVSVGAGGVYALGESFSVEANLRKVFSGSENFLGSVGFFFRF
ncbi:MAG: hypothetical protein AAF990_13650 [Bacteroidota bacterium]